MRSIRFLAVVLSLLVVMSGLVGCGPSTPSIQTVVQQIVQAQTSSILSQVDWKQVMTALEGRVGPETVIEVEGYMKHAAGMTIRIHGGELNFRTQASGTGGRDNTQDMQSFIQPILQRWENQDNLTAEAKRRIAGEVADAIVRYFEAKNATTAKPAAPVDAATAPPATVTPGTQPAQ